MTTPARIKPLTPDQMTQAQRDYLGPWRDLRFSQVLMRNPRLYDKFIAYLTELIANTGLPTRDRQIICLYMLELCGDTYEKTHHIHISQKSGLTEAEIASILAGGGAGLDDWDHAVMTGVEELFRDQSLTDQTWAKLAARYNDEQLIEFVYLNGCYNTMAMLTKSLGIELEDDLTRFNQHRSYD